MSDIVRERAAALKDFSGGLNNFWDPSTIAENEVPFLENLEFSPTGALTSRQPIWADSRAFPETGVFFNLLGYYVKENGNRYGVFTSDTKTYVIDFDNELETWVEIWNHKAADFVQYQGYIIMCRTDGAGAYWKEGGAPGYNSSTGLWDVASSTYSTIATMPAGSLIELFQERLFVSGVRGATSQSTIYWSNVTGEIDGAPGQDWRWFVPITSFADVNTGDGQWITALVPGYNEITIFRNASTFRFTYSDVPYEGTMSRIQQGIGAENNLCVARYENTILVLSGDQVYTYYNGSFQSINDQKVRLEEKTNASTLKIRYALSVVGARLLVFFGGNIFVAQLKSGTWSTWNTTTELAYFKELPSQANNIGETKKSYGITSSPTSSKWKLLRMFDHTQPDAQPEPMTCTLRTRIYDFNTPNEFKRLYWWAADVMGRGAIRARVYPVSVETMTTSSWDNMARFTWDELVDWDNAAPDPYNIETISTFTYKTPERLSLKLDHGIRFRRVYFELYLDCDGTASTSPAQIFSITPMIGAKSKTVDRIS